MKTLISFILLAFSTLALAQKMEITHGSFKQLSAINEYQLKFDYSELNIKDFESEEAYIQQEMKERKDKGTSEEWKTNWFGDRNYRYHPRFIKAFNEYFKKGEISVSEANSDAKHIMQIKTTSIYPGYNNGFSRKNGELEVTVTIFEKTSPEIALFSANIVKVKATYAGDKATLKGFDFHTGERLAYGYWNLAKFFAKRLRMGIK